LVDHEGKVWAGTSAGLDRYDPSTGKFRTYLSQHAISVLFEDRARTLWAGTNTGSLSRFDAKSERFTAFPRNPKDPANPGSARVWSIHEDRRGTIWFGRGVACTG
jgi:ligand-binding sensor domain-containing protein